MVVRSGFPLILTVAILFGLTLSKRVSGIEPPARDRVVPLPQAHAHNDYAHPRPLWDALEQGFCSVEADIFLVGEQLLVAHDVHELDPKRSLEDLYLAPLLERVQRNDGHVHQPEFEFQLLIDIKSEDEFTYKVLDEMLSKYREMLTEVNDGQVTKRAVQVVISGNRPIETISQQKIRFAAIDGRLADLDADKPSHLMPLISDRWTSHFRWKGEGDFPPHEQAKLRDIVDKAHAAGRRVRLWATPEKQTLWRALKEADVDHINTDDLTGLAEFLR